MFPIELNINVPYLKQSFQFREELLINPKNTKNIVKYCAIFKYLFDHAQLN
jgi:hypothetical protein